jgi:hypothetical protein
VFGRPQREALRPLLDVQLARILKLAPP